MDLITGPKLGGGGGVSGGSAKSPNLTFFFFEAFPNATFFLDKDSKNLKQKITINLGFKNA